MLDCVDFNIADKAVSGEFFYGTDEDWIQVLFTADLQTYHEDAEHIDGYTIPACTFVEDAINIRHLVIDKDGDLVIPATFDDIIARFIVAKCDEPKYRGLV